MPRQWLKFLKKDHSTGRDDAQMHLSRDRESPQLSPWCLAGVDLNWPLRVVGRGFTHHAAEAGGGPMLAYGIQTQEVPLKDISIHRNP